MYTHMHYCPLLKGLKFICVCVCVCVCVFVCDDVYDIMFLTRSMIKKDIILHNYTHTITYMCT